MNDTDPVQSPGRDIVAQKVRRAAGLNALRKIGTIVATERQADNESAKLLRWFSRYGLLVLLGAALLVAYAMDII